MTNAERKKKRINLKNLIQDYKLLQSFRGRWAESALFDRYKDIQTLEQELKLK